MWGSSTQKQRPAHPHTHVAHTAHTWISNAHTLIAVVHTRKVTPVAVRTGKAGSKCCYRVDHWSKQAEMRVFHCLARLWLGGKRSRDYLPVRATSTTQTARHRARPEPKLAPGVKTGPLRVPQPRARGTTRGRKRKGGPCAKKSEFGAYLVYLFFLAQ